MDVNGDKINDILSGSYSRMQSEMAGLFHVLYGNKDGTFRKAEVLKGTDGEPLIIPIKDESEQTQNICTRPFAADWNSDGHLDLVVGNFAGSFYWFKGEGEGQFQPMPEAIESNDGQRLKITGVHSDPFIIDWDGDGDLDLLSGSSNGGAYWAENIGKKGNLPQLKPFATLIAPRGGVSYGEPLSDEELTGPTTSTRIWVDDVNGDGKLDVLLGDSVTLVSPAKGVSLTEYRTKRDQWQKDLVEASKAMQSESDSKKQQKLQQDYFALYQKKSEFMNEDRTGFVWLYLRK